MKIKVLIRGILAGFAISFGGWLALRTNAALGNNILGSFIFSKSFSCDTPAPAWSAAL